MSDFASTTAAFLSHPIFSILSHDTHTDGTSPQLEQQDLIHLREYLKNCVPLIDHQTPSAELQENLAKIGATFNGYGFVLQDLPLQIEHSLQTALAVTVAPTSYLPPIPAKSDLDSQIHKLSQSYRHQSWVHLVSCLVNTTARHFGKMILEATHKDEAQDQWSNFPDVISVNRINKYWPRLGDHAYEFVVVHLRYAMPTLLSLGLNPACCEFLSALESFIDKMLEGNTDAVTSLYESYRQSIDFQSPSIAEYEDKLEYLAASKEVWESAVTRKQRFWGKASQSFDIRHTRSSRVLPFNQRSTFLGTGFYFTHAEFSQIEATLPRNESAPFATGSDLLTRLFEGQPEPFMIICDYLDVETKFRLSLTSKSIFPKLKAFGFSVSQRCIKNPDYRDFALSDARMVEVNGKFCFRCGNWMHALPRRTGEQRRMYAQTVAGTDVQKGFVGPLIRGQEKDGMVWLGRYWITGTGRMRRRWRKRFCFGCAGHMRERFGVDIRAWWEQARGE